MVMFTFFVFDQHYLFWANKIPVSGLVTAAVFNTKIREVENKIPDVRGLVPVLGKFGFKIQKCLLKVKFGT